MCVKKKGKDRRTCYCGEGEEKSAACFLKEAAAGDQIAAGDSGPICLICKCENPTVALR